MKVGGNKAGEEKVETESPTLGVCPAAPPFLRTALAEPARSSQYRDKFPKATGALLQSRDQLETRERERREGL